ncbi:MULTISPECIES: hypothetical protein [unclassified Microbacterium]|jgi:hypothetical protein|uniref:hypothetical protein n=1 Tax=unclassified Microbacterium TaxID=2609290 RepID=UPI000CFEEE69|nr:MULTISPECIES: hypothetical protein [unclassified Microbacterium]PRB61713.1 hypothetical protein CQ034_12265 [Microbacterium sp. MYb45]
MKKSTKLASFAAGLAIVAGATLGAAPAYAANMWGYSSQNRTACISATGAQMVAIAKAGYRVTSYSPCVKSFDRGTWYTTTIRY